MLTSSKSLKMTDRASLGAKMVEQRAERETVRTMHSHERLTLDLRFFPG